MGSDLSEGTPKLLMAGATITKEEPKFFCQGHRDDPASILASAKLQNKRKIISLMTESPRTYIFDHEATSTSFAL